MASLIDLSVSDYQAMAQGFDDILRITGSPCVIYYPAIQTPCSNCALSPFTNKSTGIYIHGGPSPFPANGICPMCTGVGTLAVQTTETITCTVYFDPQQFRGRQPDSIKISKGIIQIKGAFTDAYKVQRADYILPAGQNTKYKLTGDIIPINEIVKNRYFIAYLDRVS